MIVGDNGSVLRLLCYLLYFTFNVLYESPVHTRIICTHKKKTHTTTPNL